MNSTPTATATEATAQLKGLRGVEYAKARYAQIVAKRNQAEAAGAEEVETDPHAAPTTGDVHYPAGTRVQVARREGPAATGTITGHNSTRNIVVRVAIDGGDLEFPYHGIVAPLG